MKTIHDIYEGLEPVQKDRLYYMNEVCRWAWDYYRELADTYSQSDSGKLSRLGVLAERYHCVFDYVKTLFSTNNDQVVLEKINAASKYVLEKGVFPILPMKKDPAPSQKWRYVTAETMHADILDAERKFHEAFWSKPKPTMGAVS